MIGQVVRDDALDLLGDLLASPALKLHAHLQYTQSHRTVSPCSRYAIPPSRYWYWLHPSHITWPVALAVVDPSSWIVVAVPLAI